MGTHAGTLLRAYGCLALVGWFGGILTSIVFLGKAGFVPWPLLLVVAACVPLIPLMMTRGRDILPRTIADLLPSGRVRGPTQLAWAVAIVIMSGLVFAAFVTWRQGNAQAEVRELVSGVGEDAVVIVDGETWPTDRARELLVLLRDLRRLPAHHSSPGPRFPVLLRSDRGDLDLEMGRDSKHPREYWVYAMGHGELLEMNEIGRIKTDLLDGVTPVPRDSHR